MSRRMWRLLAASVLVTGLVGPVAAGPAQAVTARVTMANMKFTPDRLDVQLGDTVVWVAGDDSHTVTARDGSFDSSSRGVMGQGDEFRWRFRVPGEYAYYCRIHGSRGMQGVVVVTDPSAPTTTSTRPTPVTAAATTSTTAAADSTTTSSEPVTTTSRVLATSSTTLVKDVVTTTAPPGVPVVPQEPPALNLSSPVLGSAPASASLPEARAAARRSGGSSLLPVALGVGGVALLGVLGVLAVRRRAPRARRR